MKRADIQIVRKEIEAATGPPLYEATLRKIHHVKGSIEAELRGARTWVRARLMDGVKPEAMRIGGPCLLAKAENQWFCLGTYTEKAKQASGSSIYPVVPTEELRLDGVGSRAWTDLQLERLPDRATGAVLGLTFKPLDSNGGYLIVRRKGSKANDDYQPWVGGITSGIYVTTQVIVGVDLGSYIQYKIGLSGSDEANVRIRLQGYLMP